MPPTTQTLYNSRDVTHLTGCTYRQLDHAIRTGILTGDKLSAGSGSRRAFTADQVHRLAVAYQLAGSIPRYDRGASSLWPTMLEAVLAGPTPPPNGFAVLDVVGRIRYPDRLTVDDVPVGALVMAYDVRRLAAELYEADR